MQQPTPKISMDAHKERMKARRKKQLAWEPTEKATFRSKYMPHQGKRECERRMRQHAANS